MTRLDFDLQLAHGYSNESQRIRILSENWVLNNLFCPKCGNPTLAEYDNNMPVADFHCLNCNSDFELKSKCGSIGAKIVDGAYSKMIERITSLKNPNFLFLNYSKSFSINNLLVIPNVFFTPEIIEKRKPLSPLAKRSGWIGCNILFTNLPQNAKIYIVANGILQPKQTILDSWSKISFLKNISLQSRGWLFEIMRCIDALGVEEFQLRDLYKFERHLETKFPLNKNIRPKIRQQLQVLRDFGYLSFLGKGNYKISNK